VYSTGVLCRDEKLGIDDTRRRSDTVEDAGAVERDVLSGDELDRFLRDESSHQRRDLREVRCTTSASTHAVSDAFHSRVEESLHFVDDVREFLINLSAAEARQDLCSQQVHCWEICLPTCVARLRTRVSTSLDEEELRCTEGDVDAQRVVWDLAIGRSSSKRS
jgi:hypothetical protein